MEHCLTTVALKKLKLENTLLEGGVKVNHKGYDGKTALIIACSVFIEDVHHSNIVSFVRLLIMHGANPKIRDMKGRTCLMYAFQHTLPLDVIDMSLTYDASPTIEDNGGNNALYFI
jgi:ankyrin repeat protein